MIIKKNIKLLQLGASFGNTLQRLLIPDYERAIYWDTAGGFRIIKLIKNE